VGGVGNFEKVSKDNQILRGCPERGSIATEQSDYSLKLRIYIA